MLLQANVSLESSAPRDNLIVELASVAYTNLAEVLEVRAQQVTIVASENCILSLAQLAPIETIRAEPLVVLQLLPSMLMAAPYAKPTTIVMNSA